MPTRRACPPASRTASTTARALFGCVIAAALALPGCGGLSSQQRAEQAASSADLLRNEAMFALGYRNEWVGVPYIGDGAEIVFAEAYDDVVLLLDSASRFTALDTATGLSRWSIELTDATTEFVGIARSGDLAFAASASELFIVRIREGALTGRQSLVRIAGTEPVVFGDTVVFGTPGGEVFAHKFGLGFRAWGNKVGTTVSKNAAVLPGSITVAADDGNVLFVDPKSGKRTGQISVYGPPGSNPVAGTKYVYLASRDQSLYAFDPAGGGVVWRERTSTPLTAQPTFHQGALYMMLPEQGLVAFDAETGSRRWTSAEVAGHTVAISQRGLITFDGGPAWLLDPQRGDVIEAVDLDDVDRLLTDSFEDGHLYVLTDDGRVGRYQARF
ncbi:MAG: PQQ-binding-like beta-propeller repeat protein [Planctomycetota bacterium]